MPLAGGAAGRLVGALAVDLRKASKPAEALVLWNCQNVILATGGPGALFGTTLAPSGGPSRHGIALKAGAAAANLTETRFGLVFARAKKPISGIYQQVIPSYYSLTASLGLEAAYRVAGILAAYLRLGYHYPEDVGALAGLTVGAGVKSLSSIRAGLDYALTTHGMLGAAHHVSLRYRL